MYSLLLTSNGKDVCFSLYCEGNSKKKADTCFSISSVVLCFCWFFFSSQPEIPMLRNNSLHCRHSRSRVKVAACLSLALDILCVWLPHSASPPYHIIYVKKKRKKDSFSSALGMCFIKLNTYKKLYLERQISKEKPPTSESGIAAKRIFTEIFLRGADEH